MSTETDTYPTTRSDATITDRDVEEVQIVNEEDERKFVERNYFSTDNKFEYPRNGTDPGLVLIFNQVGDPAEPRRGCNRDINEIVLCFQRQGFNIGLKNIMNDGTSKQILDKLEETSKITDLSQKNCLIIFFLSHGDNLERLYTKDGYLQTSDIWDKFVDCPDLQNKPKMFVFQACKGDKFSTTDNTSAIRSPIVSYKMFSDKPIGDDMLVVYSTIEDNVSFRHSMRGSWFIQEICKNVTAYGKRDDVVSLIIRTTKCVCGNYFNKDGKVVRKQVPMFVSTLSKQFYLNRNKDRDLLIRLLEYNEEISSTMKSLNDKVDKLTQYLKYGECDEG